MKLFLSICRKIWYVIASAIILMAFMVMLVRVLTPTLNYQKAVFEHWASELLGAPVKIGYLRAHWDGFQPDLKLEDVNILSMNGKQTRLHFTELQVDINLLSSLLHWRIQPNKIDITGAHFVIHQLKNNQFQLNALLTKAIDMDESTSAFDNKFLMSWISEQQFLSLSDSTVDFYSVHGDLLQSSIHALSLTNKGDTHFLSGDFTLFKKIPAHIRIAATLEGTLENYQKEKIQLYLDLQNFEWHQSNYHPAFYGNELNKGLFNGQVWIDVNNLQIQSVQSVFRLSEATLISTLAKEPLSIKSLSGNLFWQREDHGWQFSGDQVQLETGNKVWQENNFTLIIDQNGEHPLQQLWIHYLNIHDIRQLLLSSSFNIPEKIRHLAESLKSDGDLTNFYISHQDNSANQNSFRVATQFNDFSFNRWQEIPGVSGLSGYLDISQDQGDITINSNDVTIDFGALFSKPLFAEFLSGQIHWLREEDGQWKLYARNVEAVNQAMAVYGNMGLIIPKDGINPTISLLAGADFHDSSHAPLYLPVGILDKSVVSWLNQAFPSGEGASSTIILRGPIDDFPFDHNKGIFVIDSQVRKTEFHFAPGWPNIKNLVANLIFTNRSMDCVATSGDVYGAKVDTFTAQIPYMGNAKPNQLILNGQVTGDASHFLNYLKDSPLHEGLGEAIAGINISGDTSVSLAIHVPLANPDNATVNGSAAFSDGKLDLSSWKIFGDKLHGKILFTTQSLSSAGLGFNLFNQPVALSITTVKKKNQPKTTRVSFNSHLQFSDLISQFQWPEFSDISGGFDYQGVLILPTEDKSQNSLQITSDLQGLSVNLPEPLAKKPDEKLPMNLNFLFGGALNPQLMIHLQNKMDSLFLFKIMNSQLSFYAGNLLLGQGIATIPDNQAGLTIGANLETLDWQVWQDYFNKNTESNEGMKRFARTVGNLLKTIKISVGSTIIFQQQIKNALINLTPQPEGWNIAIASLRIDGDLFVPTNYQQAGLTGHFHRLYLQEIKGAENATINPGSIPPLQLSMGDFQYGVKYFGAIDMNTYPEGHALIIRSLKANSSLLTADLSGYWKQLDDKTYQSHLTGKVSSDNINDLLQTFDFSTSIIAGKGSANFDFTWPNAIYQWQIKAFNGTLNLNLGAGRVIDLGEAATKQLSMGRLLTLLSIHRLMHMDYSDFSEQGYHFETLTGDFILNSGSVTTQNLVLIGAVADIAIKGAIDLLKQTLDLKLAIAPHTTSSLPIVVAIINPIAGAATWAANSLFGSKVDKATGTLYSVTGDWKKPAVEKITR